MGFTLHVKAPDRTRRPPYSRELTEDIALTTDIATDDHYSRVVATQQFDSNLLLDCVFTIRMIHYRSLAWHKNEFPATCFNLENPLKSVQTITLDDGSIVLVEMEQIESAAIPDSVAGNSANKNSALGLPSSAVPTSALDKVVDTVKSLQSTLKGAVQIVHAALQDSAPSEWGVELNIGFKGTTRPIPVIVSGEATASLKVHAKWKKSGVKGDS